MKVGVTRRPATHMLIPLALTPKRSYPNKEIVGFATFIHDPDAGTGDLKDAVFKAKAMLGTASANTIPATSAPNHAARRSDTSPIPISCPHSFRHPNARAGTFVAR